MRVLHVLDHSVPLHSGYSFRTLALLSEQRKLGWETFHLTSTKHYGSTSEIEEIDGVQFYRTHIKAKWLHGLPVIQQVATIVDTQRRLGEVVALTRPDLIHAHSPCLNGIAALRIGRRCRLPVVYEMRASWEDAAVDHRATRAGSVRYRLSRGLETWVLKRADAVTTICEGLRNDIASRGIAEERIAMIPNGVNVEAFPVIDSPDVALQSRLGLQGAFVIGFLGSFYGYEGLDLLVAALPEILRFEPSAKLLLVGGGREEQALAEQAVRLGVRDRVVMTGRVPNSEISRYYSVVDLLAFPRKSIRLTETVTPLKPLEAMAQGRLVMASNVGGHRELIKDGHTGFLFKPDDPLELAKGIKRVLDARSVWQAMRDEARRFVVRERTWCISASHYPGVYEAARRVAARRR